MIYVSTKVDIRGEKEFKQLLSVLKGRTFPSATVGVHEGAGNYPGPNAPSVAEVALWNEFGTRTSPARSFLRSAVEENASKIKDWWIEVIREVLANPTAGKRAWVAAMKGFGFRVQVLVQNKIKSNVPPPNAPSTVKAKQRQGLLPKNLDGGTGKTGTLINTGLLLRSITSRVE